MFLFHAQIILLVYSKSSRVWINNGYQEFYQRFLDQNIICLQLILEISFCNKLSVCYLFTLFIMSNRKWQILQLEPVSKCKKEKVNNAKKIQDNRNNHDLYLVHRLDQEYPEPAMSSLDLHLTNKIKQIPYEARDFEDSNLTKHIAQQLLIIKIMMFVMAILSIILARLREEASKSLIFSIEGGKVILIFHTLLTVSICTYLPTLVILAILKHIKIRELTIKQLIRFSPYQLNFGGLNVAFIVQLVFLTIHPNLIFENEVIWMKEPIYSQNLKLSSNNLLQILMLGRIYLVYSAVVSSTIYLSTRGSRICRIYGTKCNLYFGFKCLFNTMPLFFLMMIFISTLFIFGQMVRLSEDDVESSKLGNFGNSLWCVMITMGTVGYGDYYPQTYVGRIILFLASISGIIIASLLILTLSTYLSMQLSQNKSHITLHRLVLRKKLEQLGKGAVKKLAILSRLQNKQSQKQMKMLKKNTEDVKYTLRKIKNLIDTDNVNEEMDRLFESLQDNMKDAYLNQIKYSAALSNLHEVEMQKIKEMKFSFTQEIENIIKDR